MAKEVHGAAIEIIQTWVRISVFLFLHITICCVLLQQKNLNITANAVKKLSI